MSNHVCQIFRYIFPDFLPNPDMMYRDKLAEKLQRHDMIRRRTVMDVPEFYVGTFIALYCTNNNIAFWLL